jgi:DHA1 family bicyclomycin/chloramphenicol resistance-like MFS transporter
MIMNEMTDVINKDADIKQTYLGKNGLIVFIAMMNMFIPLSTDMYLPSLPDMSTYFGSSSSVTNLTLSAFFLFYAAGILFWGPLSDKYGRRKILLAGSMIYMLSSIACAFSFNIYFLIAARILQGIGAGGITSVSLAIIKDSFSGKRRETILAICQSISGLAPMLAPVIGAMILNFTNWRGVFWVLALISLINFVMAVLFQETLKEENRYHGTLLGSVGRLFVVAKNKSFILPVLIFSLNSLPFLGYIAVSSYIYVDYFGLSAQAYSYFFAANALVSMVGPFLYIKFFCQMKKRTFASMIMFISALSGVLVMTVGTVAPLLFWGSFVFMSLAGTIMRPFSTNMLLDQQKSDIGSASSIINTLFTVLGSVGMSIASMPWSNIVVGLGALITVFSLVALVCWSLFMKSKIPCSGVKD